MGDDLREIITEFANIVPHSLKTIANALQSNDHGQVFIEVHTLKSSSGNIGLSRFSHLCGILEQQARHNKMRPADAQLRQIIDYQDLPILMLTGLSDVESVDKAFDAGATDFITKPINWSLLEQRIRYALRAMDMHKSLQKNQAKLKQAQRIARLGYWEMEVDSNDIVCSTELL